jgi:hypothetical protein
MADPIKLQKKAKVLLAVLIVCVLGLGTLGYFYYQKYNRYNDLTKEKAALKDQKDQEIVKLQKQISDLSGSGKLTADSAVALTKESEQLKSDKKALQDQINALNSKITLAKTYNEMFKYYNTVIETHAGFTGWTDAEFQSGKALAEKTGNPSYINTVNWAWYETTVPPFDRALRFQKETASGIESSLK